MSETTPSHRHVRRGGPPWPAIAVVLVVAVVLGWWLWSRSGGEPEPDVPDAAATAAEDRSTEPASETPGDPWAATLGGPTPWPADLDAPGTCPEVETRFERLCRAVDRRPEVAKAGGLCSLIEQGAASLAANPPSTEVGLRDYQAVVSNVFHLVTALGLERVDLLREVLREEQDRLAEPMALALYDWAVTRDECGPGPLDREAMYGYASFLFGTTGGQAYLRRRSPRVEALVSFWALVVVDRADREGRNPAGVDLRPEIRRTRALIEGLDFHYRDEYLAVLDRMSTRWSSRVAR